MSTSPRRPTTRWSRSSTATGRRTRRRTSRRIRTSVPRSDRGIPGSTWRCPRARSGRGWKWPALAPAGRRRTPLSAARCPRPRGPTARGVPPARWPGAQCRRQPAWRGTLLGPPNGPADRSASHLAHVHRVLLGAHRPLVARGVGAGFVGVELADGAVRLHQAARLRTRLPPHAMNVGNLSLAALGHGVAGALLSGGDADVGRPLGEVTRGDHALLIGVGRPEMVWYPLGFEVVAVLGALHG